MMANGRQSVHTFRIFYNTKLAVTNLIYRKGRGIHGEAFRNELEKG